MKYLFSFLLSILIFNGLQAQTFHRLSGVSVTENEVAYANPWVGGLNAPQWSPANLNNDGKTDLYLFDRNGNVHLPFINVGGPGEAKYEFAPRIATNWPSCALFAYLRDFNHDGVPDLFTQSFTSVTPSYPGIRVFVGKFVGGELTFEQITFPDFETDALFFTLDGEKHLLTSQTADLPAIDDIDGDGDLDILALAGNGGYVNYFKNMADENGYTDDTLIYEVADECWGKFYLQPFAQSFDLSCSPDLCALDCFSKPPITDDRNGVHGGATICTFDNNNDGTKELLYGDLIWPNLIFGENGGTIENAWVNMQDSQFPSYDISVDITEFPAAFYLDYDNDGANDLMVSTNLQSGSFDYEVGWFYKNIATTENPEFALQGKDFLVQEMIDFGTGANPTFVDYNTDGLMDIVVGNNKRWTDDPDSVNDPALILFENVGTPTAPAFEIVDRNWLDFNQFDNAGIAPPFDFCPTFGDLDSDGDLDLLVGERYGSLFFVENLAGPGAPLSFGPIQPQWKGIFVGSNSTPAIHDMNGDGLADLVIGERNGTVNFMPNIGSSTQPDFHSNPDEAPNNFFFGEINTQHGGVTGYTAPVVLAFDNEIQIVVGEEDGWLQHYRVIPDNINAGPFELLDATLGEGLREGFNSRVAFTDLDGDEFLDAVIGNDRGGLSLFSSPITVDGLVPAEEKLPAFGIQLFPNPTKNNLTVQLATAGIPNGKYRLFNALGQHLAAGQINSSELTLSLQDWQSGIYFLQVEMDGETMVRRFVKN